MSGGNQSRLRVKEFGDFVSEFPIRELKNIHSVDDILPEDAFDNSSDSSNVTDGSMPHWRAVQARTVLGDVIMKQENWGPVSELSGNWELKNIKYDFGLNNLIINYLCTVRLYCSRAMFPKDRINQETLFRSHVYQR